MRRLLKLVAIETLSLMSVTICTRGLIFNGGISGLLATSICLMLANRLIKPVINIFLLPLNLLTFGTLKFLSIAITLKLVDLVLPHFDIKAFSFIGIPSDPSLLPQFSLSEGVLSIIAFSIVLTIISGFWSWLLK